MYFRIESNLEDIILPVLEECGLKNPHRGVDLRSHDFATIKALSRRFGVWIVDFLLELAYREKREVAASAATSLFFSYPCGEYKRL